MPSDGSAAFREEAADVDAIQGSASIKAEVIADRSLRQVWEVQRHHFIRSADRTRGSRSIQPHGSTTPALHNRQISSAGGMKSPTLDAGPVTLRAWREDDAEAYVAGRDEEIFRWTSEPVDLTPEDVRTAIGRLHQAPDIVGFAIITDLEQDVPAGNLTVVIRDEVAQVSYWLTPAARGKGYGVAALRTVCGWLDSRGGVTRIEALTHPKNVASQRTARSAGFVDAGERASDAPYAENGQVAVLVRECSGR